MSEPEAKKSLGQHWLHDETVLDEIVSSASVQAGDTVLEVGPGTGTLTAKLLDAGATVVAVELDESLASNLKKKFSGLPFTLNMLSITKFDFSAMPEGYKLAANIPYYLTAHLLRLLTETQHKPKVAALLVQKEVAERVAAKPGDMSFISLAVQFYYEVSLGSVVPAELFTPPPKVNSQILILKKRDKPMFDVPTKDFFRVAKAGFSQRRKTLLNSLSGGLRLSKDETTKLLETAGLNPTSRPQELSLQDWHQLYKASI